MDAITDRIGGHRQFLGFAIQPAAANIDPRRPYAVREGLAGPTLFVAIHEGAAARLSRCRLMVGWKRKHPPTLTLAGSGQRRGTFVCCRGRPDVQDRFSASLLGAEGHSRGSLGVDCGDDPAAQKNHASALKHQLDAWD
jgi:hypothetical protein